MTVVVSRFSTNGFNPVYQSDLQESTAGLLDDGMLEKVPVHLRSSVIEIRREINPNWQNQLMGYWVFIGSQSAGEIPAETSRFLLNHMSSSQKAACSWNETTLPEDTLVYRGHSALRGEPITLWQAVKERHDSVYVFVT